MAHDPRLAALLDQLPPRQVYRVVGNDANTASFWGQCGSLRAAFTGDPFPALYEGTISYHGHILPARGAVRQSDALPPLSAMQALQAAAHAGILRLVLPEGESRLEAPLELRQLQELVIPDGYRVPSGAFAQCAALERVWFLPAPFTAPGSPQSIVTKRHHPMSMPCSTALLSSCCAIPRPAPKPLQGPLLLCGPFPFGL